MSILQQLIEHIEFYDSFGDECKIKSWSVEDDKIKVEYDRNIALDYYVCGTSEDDVVEFESLEFVAEYSAICKVPSLAVKLGEEVQLEFDEITLEQIVDVQATSNKAYDEKILMNSLQYDLEDNGYRSQIYMPQVELNVKFRGL